MFLSLLDKMELYKMELGLTAFANHYIYIPVVYKHANSLQLPHCKLSSFLYLKLHPFPMKIWEAVDKEVL